MGKLCEWNLNQTQEFASNISFLQLYQFFFQKFSLKWLLEIYWKHFWNRLKTPNWI